MRNTKQKTKVDSSPFDTQDRNDIRAFMKKSTTTTVEEETAEKVNEKKLRAVTSNKSQYILVVVLVLLIGLGSIMGILTLRPDSDPLIVSGIVTGIITLVASTLVTFIKTVETHDLVNSRTSEAIDDAEEKAFLRGVEVGQARANKRTDKLESKKKQVSVISS